MDDGVKKRRLPVWLEVLVLLALVAGAVFLLRAGYRQYMTAAYPLRYQQVVDECAAQYGLHPSLVYAVIRTESGFDPKAVSPAKARGLMQLTKDTFEWAQRRVPYTGDAEEDALFDPQTNIRYGVLVLHLLGEQFEDEDTILAAYNAGMGNVSRWLADAAYSDDGVTLREIPYPETRNYVQRVRDAQAMYRKLYDLE